MARTQKTPIVATERRDVLPPPAPAGISSCRCLFLHWICGVISTAGAIFAYAIAKVFIEPHLVDGQREQRGAQPPAVEVPPHPHGAPIDGPFRVIHRLRVRHTFWTWLVITLIAMSITRGPMSATDLSVNSSSLMTHVPIAGLVGMTVGEAGSANVLQCAIASEVDVDTAEPPCESKPDE